MNVLQSVLLGAKNICEVAKKNPYDYLNKPTMPNAIQIIYDLGLSYFIYKALPGSKVCLYGVGMYFNVMKNQNIVGKVAQAWDRAKTSRDELVALLPITRMALDILPPPAIDFAKIPRKEGKDLKNDENFFFEQIETLYNINKVALIYFTAMHGLSSLQEEYKFDEKSPCLSLSYQPSPEEIEFIPDTPSKLLETNINNSIILIKKALIGVHQYDELDHIGKLQKNMITDNMIDQMAQECLCLWKNFKTEGGLKNYEKVKEVIIAPRNSNRLVYITAYLDQVNKFTCSKKDDSWMREIINNWTIPSKHRYLNHDFREDAVQTLYDFALFNFVNKGIPGSKVHFYKVGMFFDTIDTPTFFNYIFQGLGRQATSREELKNALPIIRLALDIIRPQPIDYSSIPTDEEIKKLLKEREYNPHLIFNYKIQSLYQSNPDAFIFFTVMYGLIANQKIYQYNESFPLSLDHPPTESELDLIPKEDDAIKKIEEKNLKNAITLIKQALAGKYKFGELSQNGEIQKQIFIENKTYKQQIAERCSQLWSKMLSKEGISSKDVMDLIITPRDNERKKYISMYIKKMLK